MDNKLEAWIQTWIAKEKHAAYALVNEDLRIQSSHATLRQWVFDAPPEIIGQFLPNLFPELIGVEDILYQLACDGGEPFLLPRIQHSSPAEKEQYFDLEITPIPFGDKMLLVLITDVTLQVRREQQLQQQQNELRLRNQGETF